MQIDVGTESNRTANQPTDNGTDNTADETQDRGFDEEKLFHVAVGGAERFQDTDFATALEDSHDECIDDPERGDSKSHTAKDNEKNVQNLEKTAQSLRDVEKRKNAEAKIFELGFGGFHERRAFHANGEA